MTDPLRGGSAQPLATLHDVGLYDLDGVLYLGADAVPGAPEAVASAAAAGLRAAYVTNNAARTPAAVADHLSELGIPAQVQDVVTSAQAAATLVAGLVPAGSAVLVVGGEGLVVALRERGLVPVDEAAGAAAVVQGFSPDVGWRLLAQGAYAVAAGLPWVASNMDLTVPTAGGTAPGNGSLVAAVAAAGGRGPDAVAGKPQTSMHRESVERTGARSPLVIGDRLDTDIEGARRAGVDSLLVLTGVSGPRDLVLAPKALRPTYVSIDLGTGLLEPHPGVQESGGGWACDGWTVTVPRSEGQVIVAGGGSLVDGLRALCVAWWTADRTAGVNAVGPALSRIGW